MNRNICILTLAVFALTSCQEKDCPDEARHDNRIVFGICSGTKAVTETTSSSLDNGFKVAAVFCDDNSVLFNESVTKTNGVWTTGTAQYFVPGRMLDFYAVYPGTQSITISQGKASLYYDASGASKDLVVSQKKSVENSAEPVSLRFEHILAQTEFKCKSESNSYVCKVNSISVEAPQNGTYSYDGNWSAGPSMKYNVSSTPVTVVPNSATAVGQSMTFLPGNVKVTVEWTYFRDSKPLGTYQATINLTLAEGVKNSCCLTLPNASGECIAVVTTTSPWKESTQTITITKKDPRFTVGPDGRGVVFTSGNLYWDGSHFGFEDYQYVFPETWDVNHVGHFFWATAVSEATAQSYGGTTPGSGDVFFTNVPTIYGEAAKYRTLSAEEWGYLISGRADAKKKMGYATVGGNIGIIIVPDEFTDPKSNSSTYYKDFRSVVSSGSNIYNGVGWSAMEAAGAVFLPCAGVRFGSSVSSTNNTGRYWSSTPGSNLFMGSNFCRTDSGASLSSGYSIRLVSDLE